jgi:putative cell wall-binding protein
VKCIGGSRGDGDGGVLQTSDGGYLFFGSTGSTDGDFKGNHGGIDAYIAKFDSAGTKKWVKCIGGSGDETDGDVLQTSDGGYLLYGWTYSTDGDFSGNHGGIDAYIAKFDSSGTKKWVKCIGGSGDDSLSSVIQTSDGGYLLFGDTDSTDGDFIGNHGYKEVFIVKFDSSGTKKWVKCFGGRGNDEVHDVFQTSDGGYLLLGRTDSTDGDLSGAGNHSGGDAYIAKFDSAGVKKWVRCIGGSVNFFGSSSHDSLTGVFQTSDGGYLLFGDTDSIDGDFKSAGNQVNGDVFIAKFDSTGTKKWVKCIGGGCPDYASGVIQTSDGGYVLFGYTESTTGDFKDAGNHGDYDIFVAKFSIPVPVTRVAGADHFKTAVLASKAAFAKPSATQVAIVATDSGFADALSASTLAGTVKAPILLTGKTTLQADTKAELTRLKVKKVYVIGGSAVITAKVVKEIEQLPSKPTVVRLWGQNQYDTSLAVANEAVRLGASKTEVYVCNGEGFQDALAVSSFAASQKVPIILTSSRGLDKQAKSFITQNQQKRVYVIGGYVVIPDSALTAIQKADKGASVARLWGQDWTDTALTVAKTLIKHYKLQPTLIGVASGEGYYDALSGGASIGNRGGVLLLTKTSSLPACAKTPLTASVKTVKKVEIIGGVVVVKPAVETAIKKVVGA